MSEEQAARMPPAPQLNTVRAVAPSSSGNIGDHALGIIERVTTEVCNHLGRIRSQLDELDQTILTSAGAAQSTIKNHLRVAQAAIEAGDLIAMRISELQAMAEQD